MNERITTKRLQTLIAKDADMDEAFVQVFMNEMVGLINEVINNGDEVIVDGLGTFRRVTLSGGQNTRLVFFPDRSMKDGVNAPFAQFEPFVICQGEEENHHPVHSDVDVHDHGNDSIHLTDNVPESENRVSLDAKSDIVQIGKDISSSDTSDIKIAEDECKLKKEQTSSKEPNNLSVVSSIDSEESATIQEKSAMERKMEEAENREYQQHIHQTEEPVEVSDGNGRLTENVDKEVDEAFEQNDRVEDTCASGECNKVSSQLSSKKYGLWAVIILLAVSIVGTMIYFFVRIYQSEKASEPTEQIAPVVVSQNRSTDTVEIATGLSDSDTKPSESEKVQENPAPISDLSSPVSTSELSDQTYSKINKDTENENTNTERDVVGNSQSNTSQKSPKRSKHFTKPSISQFPLEVELQPGERLTLLSLRYYGHKAFWVYIYDANKSKYPDPDNIPAGALLRIPSPAILGINPDDSVSIRKALDRASKL